MIMEADRMHGFETARADGSDMAKVRQAAEGESGTRIRRLMLDIEDLRIECERLRSLLIASETEVLALKDHTGRLQADLSDIKAQRPHTIERLARRLWRMVRHR